MIKYLKKEQDNYIPVQATDFYDLPSPLYIEFSSDEVWVDITFELHAGSHIFNAHGEALLSRLLSKEDTNWCLIKTIISMWNHTYREKVEYLNLHYLITHYDVVYEPNENGVWYEEKNNTRFSFKVFVQLKMISIEELIFLSIQSKYKNKIEANVQCPVLYKKFANIASFHSLTNESLFEKEYKLIKTIANSQIFKLNKSNKLYVHYSSWGYRGDSNLNHSFYSDIESMPEMNIIIRPKIRKDQSKEKSKGNNHTHTHHNQHTHDHNHIHNIIKVKTHSFKQEQPIITSDFSFIHGSGIKQYKEKSNDETVLKKLKKKDRKIMNNTSNTNRSGLMSPFEKINIHSKILFRTFEGDNSDGVIRVKGNGYDGKYNDNGKHSDHSDESQKNKDKPSIEKDIKKTVTKAFIMNIITSASLVKAHKCTFDKYSIPRIRNFKQNITLISYWKYCKSRCVACLCYSLIALFLIVLVCSLIYYCFHL